jgi:hypothetical protein
MLRRRTVLSFSAAAVLAASPLLTACGTPHAGAAAVVGGHQISESSVQARVAAVRKAQRASPESGQLIAATGSLQQGTVGTLLENAVVDRAAKDAGVKVTRAEVQQAVDSAAAQAGGRKKLNEQLLQQDAMAPGDIDASARANLQLQKIAQAGGVDLQSQDGQAAVLKVLERASKELHISVNPRYGTWDPAKFSLQAASSPWLHQVTKTDAQRQAEQAQAQQQQESDPDAPTE